MSCRLGGMGRLGLIFLKSTKIDSKTTVVDSKLIVEV